MTFAMQLHVFLAQSDAPEQGLSWWDTIRNGGTIGYIILGLSVAAAMLCVMHFMQIRRDSLIPSAQIEEIDSALAAGDVPRAIAFCTDPANDSYLTRIMAAGLLRFQKSAFGAFEIKNAIEEAGEDQTARLYRSTDALGLIGTIAPLLGLLGTVMGMVGAFESMAQSAGSGAEDMAGNISMALVTTLLGLTLAIPCVSLFTFFRNRIDAIGSEATLEIERLVLHLESTGAAGGGATKSSRSSSGAAT